MIIRVKRKDFEEGKIERTEKKGETNERRENEEKAKSIGEVDCLIHDSSVEVGYGLCYSVVSSK